MDQIKAEYNDRLKIALTLGGLRPGTRKALTDRDRQDILHHWQEVHKMTGQPFHFDNALPEGFIYDTEPASRAVVVMGELQANEVLSFFKRIQRAFYVEQQDTTRTNVLLELAGHYDVDMDEFHSLFESDEIREKTIKHFQKTRYFGVRGFPSCILQKDTGYTLLAAGYRPFEDLTTEIADLLEP